MADVIQGNDANGPPVFPHCESCCPRAQQQRQGPPQGFLGFHHRPLLDLVVVRDPLHRRFHPQHAQLTHHVVCPQQLSDKGGGRLGEQPQGSVELYHPPLLHHQDAICQAQRLFHVVGDEEDSLF